MLRRYLRSLNKEYCPVVLSITDTPDKAETETVIQRNYVRDADGSDQAAIYTRAREIYFRARRHRPGRAVSIF